MNAGDDIQLIDVRQPGEYAFAKIEGAKKLIPILVKSLMHLRARSTYLRETESTANGRPQCPCNRSDGEKRF